MEWSFLASIPGHNLLPNKQASFSIIHPQILLSVICRLVANSPNLKLGEKGSEIFQKHDQCNTSVEKK